MFQPDKTIINGSEDPSSIISPVNKQYAILKCGYPKWDLRRAIPKCGQIGMGQKASHVAEVSNRPEVFKLVCRPRRVCEGCGRVHKGLPKIFINTAWFLY